MISFETFLCVYLFGGITFLPLLLVTAFYLSSHEKRDEDFIHSNKSLVVDVEPEFKGGELDEEKGVAASKQGWVYVTKTFYPHQSDLSSTDDNEDSDVDTSTTTGEQVTRDKLKKKHKFYAVLKHGNLFLYKDSSPESGPQQVIVLKDTFVTIWPRFVSNTSSNPLPDGALFTKKTCLSIWKKNAVFLDERGSIQFKQNNSSENFYIYIANNTEKEDWYFALINATKSTSDGMNSPSTKSVPSLLPDKLANTAHFKTKDILYLIQILNSNEGQHSSRWFNALIGRLFLSLQQTDTLSNFLKEKIYKKLKKINKPGFLDDFSIESIDVGNSAPIITHPKFLDLTPEGLTKVCFNLLYTGNLNMIIATKVNLNFGSRFKKREVTIQLSMTIKKISGPLLVLIKPPPSNRIWYSFQNEPLIDIDVEPVVSTRHISYNMVTNMIKSKFKEALKESLVYPFMDDIVYFDTTQELFRGGIWSHRKSSNSADALNEQNNSKVDFNPISASLINEGNRKDLLEGESITISGAKPTESSSSSVVDIEQTPLSSTENSFYRKDSIGLQQQLNEDTLNNATPNILDNTNSSNVVPKKYIQTGIKKIGKWYKDQLSSVRDKDNTEILESKASLNFTPESSISEKEKPMKNEPVLKYDGPEMISSRRAPREKSFTPQEHSSSGSVPIPTKPEEVRSAEMFVHVRTSSMSSSITVPSPIVESHRRHGKRFAFNPQDTSPKSEQSEDKGEQPVNFDEESSISSAPPAFHTGGLQKSKRPPPPPFSPPHSCISDNES